MAGISTSIQMADRMTPVLQSITSAMNMMVGSFSAAQSMAETGFNSAQFTAMQQAAANASAEFSRYQEELERVQNTPVKAPEPPAWNSVPTQPVYMTSGADRFESEYKAASTAARQLYSNQQAISAQARSLRAVPPGMLNDVAAAANRIQSLSTRVQELNNVPVDLRTDRVNNEMESLRGRLAQATEVQGQLNAAMGRMDISAANAAYQRLNSIVDVTERDLRDNLTAQEQFNQSVRSGQTAAGGLEGSIKRYAAMLISAATAGKAISLADQVTQTTARLDLMNCGLDTTDQLQQQIFESAQRSRGAYQTTADAVAKLGMQARDAFSSNDELIAFTEQLNKSFVVAGTSAQGVDSVMLQLTQAMAAGKLQGEELNAVLDNAQPIVQNIADYMGVPVGQIKQLASEGAISAEIIKNAMFAAADETNAKFGQMPVTFGQVASSLQNQALMAFQPALQQLSAITQTEGFAALTGSVTSAIQTLASASVTALDMMGQAILFARDNWSWLGPVIGGVTAAIVAYSGAMAVCNAVQTISNGIQAIAAARAALKAGLDLAAAAATTAATGAQVGLNIAILACPLTWILVAIVAVVAAIAVWVDHVGGLKVAWLTCVNAVLTLAEKMGLGFWSTVFDVQNAIALIKLGFLGFKTAVLDTLGNLKVQGLMILQNFINGAIDHINTLINMANSIGIISIDTLQHVEFGTNAALEEEMKQEQRANEFSSHLHMDEETPHLHIDFVPFTTGSKRGMDTRVSLKQALADQGYLGGTKRETEWSQWMAAEKQELSKVMERHGVIWKQLGNHKKHLSVLDFEKQEREKEVQILTKQKEEISQDIQTIKESVTDGKKDLKELQDKKKNLQQEILKLTSDKKTTEKNIVTIRDNPAWQLPEPGTIMTAKSYRDKKAVPLLEMVKEALVSALVKNVQLNGLVEKFKRQYEYSRKQVERLEQRLDLVEKENVDFRGEILDFNLVKAVLGDREVKSIVEQKKSAETLNMLNKPQRKKEVDR